MSNWWGSVELSYQFSIVLGGLIVLTFAAAFIKLWLNTRWTARMQLKEDMEKANLTNEKVGIRQPVKLDAGNLFGVRALEKGFYGGVSQVQLLSTPSTPRSQMSKTAMNDDSASPPGGLYSSSNVSSIIEPDTGRNGQPVPKLRLQPSQSELDRIRDHTINMYATVPTSPSAASFASVDVTPHIHAEINPFEASLAPPGRAYDPQPALSSSRLTTPPIPARAVRSCEIQSPRSGNSTPSSEPVSLPQLSSQSSSLPPSRPRIIRSYSEESRNAALTQGTSNSPALPARPTSPHGKVLPGHVSKTSNGSSQYSDSVLESYYVHDRADSASTTRSNHRLSHLGMAPIAERRSPSPSPERDATHSHTRSSSGTSVGPSVPQSSTPPSSSRSRSRSIERTLARTMNSVRRERNTSTTMTDRKRDVLHYDPSQGRAARNRAGSLQGRAMDFDVPRSSPFSDLHSIERGTASRDASKVQAYRPRHVEEEDMDEEIVKENARKISVWKARELKRALEDRRRGERGGEWDVERVVEIPLVDRHEPLPSPLQLVQMWQAADAGVSSGEK